MVDHTRREAIKQIARGAAYVSPLIVSMAAPVHAFAQGASGSMMFMFCDYFPVLCMIFGGATAPGSTTPPGTGTPTPPDLPPSPTEVNPPPGGPPPGR